MLRPVAGRRYYRFWTGVVEKGRAGHEEVAIYHFISIYYVMRAELPGDSLQILN
jgi:hypothetical protein